MNLKVLALLTATTISVNSISGNSAVSVNSISENAIVHEEVLTTEEMPTMLSKSLEKAGKKEETSNSFKLKAEVCTTQSMTETMKWMGSEGFDCYVPVNHGEWAAVPELITYVNDKGNVVMSYSDNKYLYLDTLSKDYKSIKSIKIKKKYPLVGDVLADSDGYVYIVWGKEDSDKYGGVDTMAISKYTSEGKHVATTTYVTDTKESADFGVQTFKPFVSGSCDTIISNGVLVVNYAREMYNGHQSSDVLAVNIKDMSKNTNYFDYVSHSFDQRVLAKNDGTVEFYNHGDAYPRGFTAGNSSNVPFHFYGDCGDNFTYSQLGGVCDTSNGVMYSGVAPKSLDIKSKKEPSNLFVQLVNPASNVCGVLSRTGTSCGVTVTDTGILWLTDYDKNTDARNPKLVKINEDRVLVMWEQFYRNSYKDTLFTVIDPYGNTIVETTSLGNERLSTFEEPLLIGSNVVWVTAGHYEWVNLFGYKGYVVVDGYTPVVHTIDVQNIIDGVSNLQVKVGDEFKAGDFRYVVTNTKKKTLAIKSYSGKNKTLKLRDTVKYKGDTYKVTEIKNKVFQNNTAITKVSGGSNIKIVGAYAFKGCSKLSKVTLGKSLTTIKKYSFSGCKSLKSLTLKSTKLKTVGKKAFRNTYSKMKIKVPKSKLKSYKKLLKNKGLSKKVKYTS